MAHGRVERDAAIAWVLLDRRDSDPARFWSYVVAALRTVAPDVGAASLPMLQSAETPADTAITTLLNELHTVTHDVVVVFDDYHVIESPEIQDAMRFFLEHLPPRMRLVVASRADPPWPLAALRARGDLLEVRAADLRFTAEEAAAYLNDTMGLALTATDVDAIEDRTEGWIAALQLAALSMQGRDDVSGFIASFAGDDRYIVDYLVGEVLERQNEHDRHFLLHTSVLGRLTAELCDAVTGRGCAQETLEHLDRTNMFLVPLDDRREWYRYHHLFADVLRARLLDEEPALIPELHRRAAAWYEEHHDRAEAIAHALAGADFARAAALIELTAPEMQRTRQEATLCDWLEQLPEELFADRPVLSMNLVGARMATGDATGVEPLMAGIERWLDARGDATGARAPIVADADAYRAAPRAGRDPTRRAGSAGRRHRRHDRSRAACPHAHRSLRPPRARRRGRALGARELEGRRPRDRARARYEEAVRRFVAADHLPDLLGVSLGLADIQVAQGRLHDATRTLEDGLERARDHPGLRGTADMHVALSEILLEHDDLAGARRHLDVSGALGEHAGLPQHAYRWRAATARVLQAEGDLAGAIELLDAAARVHDTDFSPDVRPIAARTARIRLAQGDVATARRWATERGLAPDDEPSYVREYEHLTLARVLLAEAADDPAGGSVDDARGLLTGLHAAAEAGGRGGSVIEVLFLLALAHHAAGDDIASDTALDDALVRGAAEGYVRLFLDEGPPLVDLLRAGGRSDPATRHALRLLEAAGTVAPVPEPATGGGLVDPLSRRELDVLGLLRTDLSGPDIARELYVSLNTLRTHTKSIYAKLGVGSRRAAVRRADELGI